jgi:SAM-dependent methyltransferase
VGSVYDDRFYAKHAAPWERSAAVLVPLVAGLVQPRSVLDVGCGTGAWLAAFAAAGATEVVGVDGDYVPRERLKIPPASFLPRDLAEPLDLGRRFDLVMSLEVAEHIPPGRADAFADSLTRHADVLLFSAAIPFQGGEGHVNEQWPAYWAERFAARGFRAIDCLRPRLWSDARVQWWYAQNAVLYATAAALARLPGLQRELATAPPVPLPLVHPGKYLQLADPSRRSLRKTLRTLPALLGASLRRRVRRLKDSN